MDRTRGGAYFTGVRPRELRAMRVFTSRAPLRIYDLANAGSESASPPLSVECPRRGSAARDRIAVSATYLWSIHRAETSFRGHRHWIIVGERFRREIRTSIPSPGLCTSCTPRIEHKSPSMSVTTYNLIPEPRPLAERVEISDLPDSLSGGFMRNADQTDDRRKRDIR